MKKLLIFSFLFICDIYPMAHEGPKTLLHVPREVRKQILEHLIEECETGKEAAQNIIAFSKACKVLNADVKNCPQIMEMLAEMRREQTSLKAHLREYTRKVIKEGSIKGMKWVGDLSSRVIAV